MDINHEELKKYKLVKPEGDDCCEGCYMKGKGMDSGCQFTKITGSESTNCLDMGCTTDDYKYRIFKLIDESNKPRIKLTFK